MNRCVLAVLLLGLSCVGCSTKKTLTVDQYFHEASANFRERSYYLAIEQFHDLLDQFPFSQYSEEAELKIAHAQYLYNNYTEAIVAFNDFQRRHPTSSHLPFVGYAIGMCYAKQMETIDRDQAAAQNAQNAFLKVIQQYPDSPYADLARAELVRCRRNLAEHELYIATYYAKRRNNKAAEMRLLALASRYEDTDAAADSLLQLAKLYRLDRRDDHALLAYRALEQKHPGSAPAQVARHDFGALGETADPPAGEDPLELLLAANGRHGGSGRSEVVHVPGLEPSSDARRSSGGGSAGMTPPLDPFGRSHAH